LFVAVVDVGLPGELQSDAILEQKGGLLNAYGKKGDYNISLTNPVALSP
jgi:hypothetical protein